MLAHNGIELYRNTFELMKGVGLRKKNLLQKVEMAIFISAKMALLLSNA